MNTDLIKIDTREGYSRAVRAAAAVLASGGLVGIPTETVYGLAASAEHAEAVDRLKAAKNRPTDKKFTICLALAADVKRFASVVPRKAQKLISRFWPGPLTLVLPAAGDGTVGLRMPGLSFTREVLLRTDTTVIIPSANPHGQEPARTAGEVMDYFDGRIELVLDAGPSKMGMASSVVEIKADEKMTILRHGAISETELAEAVARTILFVCTGNMCRSPMAEGIAKKLLSERLGVASGDLLKAGFEVASSGTACFGGGPPSAEAVAVTQEIGVDISGCRSRPLSLEALRQADLIICMAPHHAHAVAALDSAAGGRSVLLLPGGATVEDPIGGPTEVYRRVRDILFDSVKARIEELVGENSDR